MRILLDHRAGFYIEEVIFVLLRMHYEPVELRERHCTEESVDARLLVGTDVMTDHYPRSAGISEGAADHSITRTKERLPPVEDNGIGFQRLNAPCDRIPVDGIDRIENPFGPDLEGIGRFVVLSLPGEQETGIHTFEIYDGGLVALFLKDLSEPHVVV